jgi:hypothetical protein
VFLVVFLLSVASFFNCVSLSLKESKASSPRVISVTTSHVQEAGTLALSLMAKARMMPNMGPPIAWCVRKCEMRGCVYGGVSRISCVWSVRITHMSALHLIHIKMAN